MAGLLEKLGFKKKAKEKEKGKEPEKLVNWKVKLEHLEARTVEGPEDWEEVVRYLECGASRFVVLYQEPEGWKEGKKLAGVDGMQLLLTPEEDSLMLQLRQTIDGVDRYYRREGITAEDALGAFRSYGEGRLTLDPSWREISGKENHEAVYGKGNALWDLYQKRAVENTYGDGALPDRLSIDMEKVLSMEVWKGGVKEMDASAGDWLTDTMVTGGIEAVAEGRANRLVINLQFQGEGIYVKKLKKKVYKPYTSTLVLHGGEETFGLVYFAGNTGRCHMLIGDFFPYMELDSEDVKRVPVGDACLPEYGVITGWETVDQALRYLFADLETADQRLSDSKLWSTDNYAGGAKRLEKLRKEWGLLEG